MINNHDPKDILKEGNDCFNSIDFVNKLEKKIRKNLKNDFPLVIGLFGKYGEGKSAIIKALDEKIKDTANIITIDAWKYDVKDIEFSLHKVYNLERDMKTVSGNLKRSFFHFLPNIKIDGSAVVKKILLWDYQKTFYIISILFIKM